MTLEVKTVKFEVRQRSCTFHQFIYRKKDILEEAIKLLKGLWPIDQPCRLLGIRFNNIRSRQQGSSNYSESKRDSSDGKQRQANLNDSNELLLKDKTLV